MKILYIGGESANWVINLCNQFCKQGHDVTCIVQQLDEYDKNNPLQPHKKLKRIDMPYNEMFNPHYMVRRLKDEFTKDKYDIIFGSHAPLSAVIMGLGVTYKIPWGVMILDIPTHLMRWNRNRMKQWLEWFKYMEFADAIIFNTAIARDEYQKYTGQYFQDNHVIPYAINMPKKFDMAGINIKGDYVISVCRLTPVKNCIIIPQALKYLEKPLKYVAVGRNSAIDDLTKIKNECIKYGIEFEHHNMVSEEKKFELIRDSSMLIYPQETNYIAGLSPLEAMYCGKPVLVRDYPILKQLYFNNVTYCDSDEFTLATKIVALHNINRKELEVHLKNANGYAKTIASFGSMAYNMLGIFERMLKPEGVISTVKQ